MRNRRNFQSEHIRTERYRNSFFPYCVSEWEKLSAETKSLPTISQFKERLLLSIRPLKRSSFGINDIPGIKILTKLRVEFSDLRYHRFSHNFNCTSPVGRCLLDEENNTHFFLRCPFYISIRNKLLGNISLFIDSDITILPSEHLTNILIYGSNVYSNVTNKLIITETIEFIRKSGRFIFAFVTNFSAAYFIYWFRYYNSSI